MWTLITGVMSRPLSLNYLFYDFIQVWTTTIFKVGKRMQKLFKLETTMWIVSIFLQNLLKNDNPPLWGDDYLEHSYYNIAELYRTVTRKKLAKSVGIDKICQGLRKQTKLVNETVETNPVRL